MSEPGKIPIGDARHLSRQYGCPVVVIFAINPDRESFTVTTYGATKGLCKLAASLGTQFADAIMKGAVSPPETEPCDVPEMPAIYAGRRSGDCDYLRRSRVHANRP